MTADDILLIVLHETVAFASPPIDQCVRADPEWRGMLTHGVPYRPDRWNGARLTSAERMALSRLLRRPEAFGLILRVTSAGYDRGTHVRPTAAGLVRALDLMPEIGPVDVLAGLRATGWGESVADEVAAILANPKGAA